MKKGCGELMTNKQGAWSLRVYVGPAVGLLIDFCRHLTFLRLGSSQLGQRGLALLSSSTSAQRTMQHEGQVFREQRAEEVSFPNLGSTRFPYYSMLLDLGRNLTSL